MRVAVHHHQRKAAPLADALRAHGHELVRWPADALLIDADRAYHRPIIDRYVDAGAAAFLYPHGAPLDLTHDLDGAYPRVAGEFVIGEGQAEVKRRIGTTAPVHVTGWFACPMAPFRATDRVRRVLFAPIHPLQDGLLVEPYERMNRTVYAALLALDGVELTVRHIQSVDANGLWEAPGVRFVLGAEDDAYAQIDEADAVVSYWGTFPCLAVARGAPTVMYGGDLDVAGFEHGGAPRRYRRWDAYHALLRYPFDVADGPLGELLEAAAASDAPIRDWRRRFIGSPWDPARFVAQLEGAVTGRGRRAMADLELRAFVVAADAREVIARPELLAAYAQRFGDADDATLLLHAPDGDQAVLVEELERALAGVGLALEALPDALLEADVGAAGADAVAARAGAVLGDPLQPAWRRLPRFDADGVDALRTLALSG